MTSSQEAGGPTGPAGGQPAATPDQAGAPGQVPSAAPPPHKIHRTRAGGVWTGLALAAVVLLLLLVFILENGKRVDISYFGAHGHLPLGVALLLAAVGGALLCIVPGAWRILQLRATARRHRAADAAIRSAPASPPSGPGGTA